MEKVFRFLKKNIVLIGFVSAFLLDNSLDILTRLGIDPFWSSIVKGLGTLIYGFYFTSSYNVKKALSSSDGDGAIIPTKGF